MVKTIRTREAIWAELQGLRVSLGLRTMDQVLDHLLTLRKRHVQREARGAKDSILALDGLGRGAWKGVDPDEYVRGLREGW